MRFLLSDLLSEQLQNWLPLQLLRLLPVCRDISGLNLRTFQSSVSVSCKGQHNVQHLGKMHITCFSAAHDKA